jgi:hypothetical protein
MSYGRDPLYRMESYQQGRVYQWQCVVIMFWTLMLHLGRSDTKDGLCEEFEDVFDQVS